MRLKPNSLLILIAIPSFLLLLNFAMAEIFVDTPIVSQTTVNPGDSFTVKANVTETSGTSNINDTNVTCVGSEGIEWQDSWDSYTKLNSSVTWTVVNDTSVEVSATITLNTSSINGSWTCKVYGRSTAGDSAVGSINQPYVNTRVGITLLESVCTFDQGSPGDTNKNWSCPAGGNNYLRYLHDGNIKINVTINGTDLVGQSDSSWIIGVGNVTYKNVTADSEAPSPPGIQLTPFAEVLVSMWERGSYPDKNANDLYCWLNYPSPLKVQTYQGTIILIAKEA